MNYRKLSKKIAPFIIAGQQASWSQASLFQRIEKLEEIVKDLTEALSQIALTDEGKKSALDSIVAFNQRRDLDLLSQGKNLASHGEAIISNGEALSAYDSTIANVVSSLSDVSNETDTIKETIIAMELSADEVTAILQAWSVKENSITLIGPGAIATGAVLAHNINIGGYVDIDEHRILVGSTVALDNDGVSIKGLNWTSSDGQIYDANKVSWEIGGKIASEMYGGHYGGNSLCAIHSISNGSGASLLLEAVSSQGLGKPSTGLTLIYADSVSSSRAMISVGGGYRFRFNTDGIEVYNSYVHTSNNDNYLKVKFGGSSYFIHMRKEANANTTNTEGINAKINADANTTNIEDVNAKINANASDINTNTTNIGNINSAITQLANAINSNTAKIDALSY